MRTIITTCSVIALCVVGLSGQDRDITIPIEKLIQGEYMLKLLDAGRIPDAVPWRPTWAWRGHWASGRPCHEVCGPVGPWGPPVVPLQHMHHEHRGSGEFLFAPLPRRPALHPLGHEK